MKEFKQSQYSDSLLTAVFSGSKKTLVKLESVYTLVRPFVIESLEDFQPTTHMGRPGNDPEVLFKMLFIEHLQGLSDREVIEGLLDRISYRRFVGIIHDEDIPDRSALIRFRQEYFKKQKPKKLFNGLFKELKDEGVIVKAGSMLDSQIVTATGRKSQRKNRRDKYARGTKKHGTKFHGYKMHCNIDADHKLIKKLHVTSANVHDFKVIEDILSLSTTSKLYADKAYTSKVQEKIYKEKKIENNVMRKGYRGHPLSKADEERNNVISKVRARVEHVFGRFVNEFKFTKARYFNKGMNEMSMFFICFLFNAKESVRCGYLL